MRTVLTKTGAILLLMLCASACEAPPYAYHTDNHSNNSSTSTRN